MSLKCTVPIVALMAALAIPSYSAAATIKKCQDAQGQWHYGDNAADECERSKITVIDKRGQTVKEVEAPPTAEEIAAEKAERERAKEERERSEQQRIEDERLLATYDSADAITRARDERIAYMKNQAQINSELLAKLRETLERQRKHGGSKAKKEIARTEAQIAEYEAANAELTKEEDVVMKKYNADLARYRQLTGQDGDNPPAGSK
jgi:hypothetical protein